MAGIKSGSAIVAALMVAGCGSGTGGGNAATAASGAPSGGYGLDWARDACKTFPAATAAKASGMAIVKAEPGNNAEATDTANSSCGYSDASGDKTFRVELRIAINGSETAASQIAKLNGDPDMIGPVEDIAAPSGKALWLPKLHEVIYYPDDERSVMVVSPGYRMFGKSDPEDRQKAQALAIALAAGGS